MVFRLLLKIETRFSLKFKKKKRWIKVSSFTPVLPLSTYPHYPHVPLHFLVLIKSRSTILIH